jgi:hypothetical protein
LDCKRIWDEIGFTLRIVATTGNGGTGDGRVRRGQLSHPDSHIISNAGGATWVTWSLLNKVCDKRRDFTDRTHKQAAKEERLVMDYESVRYLCRQLLQTIINKRLWIIGLNVYLDADLIIAALEDAVHLYWSG